jgi:hypothetical protein
MALFASLQSSGDFAVNFCLSSSWSGERGLAYVAFYYVCRIAVNELFVAAVGTTDTKEIGFGFGDEGFPIGAHDLSLTSNGQFS